MNMAAFWIVAPCSLVDVYGRFRGACCLRHQGDLPDYAAQQLKRRPSSLIALMMEAASTSETSVNFYQTARRNNPDDSHLQV
jgi:hypothetical protein